MPRFLLLIGLVSTLLFPTAQPALDSRTVPAEAELLPVPVTQGCEITIEGRHGGVAGQITFHVEESQVRTRVDWWTSLSPRNQKSERRLSPGQTFSETFEIALGCKTHRRYRFVFSHEGTEYTYTYPAEESYSQETSINLGAVSRFFGIEPAPDTEPQPATLADMNLDGEWVRSESNNDPNDGMRITVAGTQATLTFVPTTASSAWREGQVLWRNIMDNGSLQVRGSDSRYYPAQLTQEGTDHLTLSIRRGGAGNDQAWLRAGSATVACSWSTSGTATAADVWISTSSAMPEELLNTLKDVKRAGVPIQTMALTPDDEWVVVADNIPCYSEDFPAGVREYIDRYIASGREIDVVAFGSGGRWVVIAEDWMRRSGVPEVAATWVRQLQETNQRISAFAFAPDAEGVAMASEGEAFAFGPVPEGFVEAVGAARTSQRPIHDVAFSGNGAWVLVAGDWFVTSGAPLDLFQDLHRQRTDEDRRIDHVVLHPRSGENHWALLSNQPEPAPTTDADRMEREMGPDDDESIWARMKAHDIRGLAIAVVENNQIAWTRGYGLRGGADIERYVYPTTIFDAASISKPVAAVGALQLVDAGKLRLTQAGVLQTLRSPSELFAYTLAQLDASGRVTLAQLLSHCAGLDHGHGNSGAQPRDPDKNEIPIHKVVIGLPPAGLRYRAVRTFTPGDSMHYSGANYAVVQALIETHADGGFNRHMRALFNDLEMHDSSFRPPQDRARRYAYGYTECDKGSSDTCPVRAYPNKAAAGLTTTAMDLARFVIMLNQKGLYAGRRILEEETVDHMLKLDDTTGSSLAEHQCDDLGTMGLGIRIRNRGESNERFWHGGLHNGFRTFLYGYPQHKAGLILLITGGNDNAKKLRNEIRSRFSDRYL